MKHTVRSYFYLILCILTIVGCHKEEWDEYYGRPASLAQPIYQQLVERGDFTHLLSAIDKAGYKETLKGGGYWTIFAPTDSAFETFYKQEGISGDDDLDTTIANKIVRYALVYNAYRKSQLMNVQESAGPDTSEAFKRKTAYYDWVYSKNGKKIISANRNGSFNPNDNNNKYIPYFLSNFFAFNNLSAVDYNFFYPNTTYTGFNVAGAKVLKADIAAENGIIDIVNKVVLPLPSLEDYLNSNPQYSEFKRLLDKLVSYQSNDAITERENALTGGSDSVFVKLYDAGNDAGLAFSPNNENFVESSTDAQADGWSMAIPTNQVLIPYERKILAHFHTFDAAPPQVLISLLNAHLWKTSLWPSKITHTPNSEQENATFNLSNVIDQKVCSNGFFYGIDEVQQANVFRTLYSKPFLDPRYSLMTRALDAGIKFSIINPEGDFTMIMMSNKVLEQYGYSYDADHQEWTYQPPGGTLISGTKARQRIMRILQSSVFVTPDGALNDLSGTGIVESWNGEYVRYDNNTIWAGGNADEGVKVHIDSSATTVNGKVYYVDGLLTFSERTVGMHLEDLSISDPTDFESFYNYLTHTLLWDGDTKTITGVKPGAFYTILVPTNAAISKAVKEGILPGDEVTGTPDFDPSDLEDKQKVTDFIKYHILDKNAVVPDGKKSGSYPTLLKTIDGDISFIGVNNQVGNMELTDLKGNTAHVNISKSNHLCNRSVIHSIDKVLNFNAD